MTSEPASEAPGEGAEVRATVILTVADLAAAQVVGSGSGGDVWLVDARGRTADRVRRDLVAMARNRQPAWSFGVIGADEAALTGAVDSGATYVVDLGDTDPRSLAELARRGVLVVVGVPVRTDASGAHAVALAAERHRCVLDVGAPPGSVVLEVPLGTLAAAAVTAHAAGTPIGVVIEAPAHHRDVDATAIAPDDVERGRLIGLLTADLVAGATTVRTTDPMVARRVRAVVAWLVGSAIAEGDPVETAAP
ncbi:MAG: hypothetical protein ACR2MB_12025 [Acidimicrobiales bacterium]